MAANHFRLKFLRKCFIGWQLWVTEQQRARATELEHQNKAFKMASFLEAAATGKLWQNEAKETRETQKQPQSSNRQKPVSSRTDHERIVSFRFLKFYSSNSKKENIDDMELYDFAFLH